MLPVKPKFTLKVEIYTTLYLENGTLHSRPVLGYKIVVICLYNSLNMIIVHNLLRKQQHLSIQITSLGPVTCFPHWIVLC